MNPCEELGMNISAVVKIRFMLPAGFPDANSKRGALGAPRQLATRVRHNRHRTRLIWLRSTVKKPSARDAH
jgi:hypothetical protein